MKINGHSPNLQTQDKGNVQKGDVEKGNHKQADVKTAQVRSSRLESFAFNKLKSKVDSEPDVNMDKVKALKEKLKNGDYQIDKQKLAGNLLKNSALEDI